MLRLLPAPGRRRKKKLLFALSAAFSLNLLSGKEDDFGVNLESGGVRFFKINNGKSSFITKTIKNSSVINDNELTLTFCVNKKKKQMVLYVNSKFVKDWRDKTDRRWDFGNALKMGMSGRSYSTGLEISNLKISNWDGEFSKEDDTVFAEGKPDMVLLKNDDVLRGDIVKIHKDILHFKSVSGLNFDLPLKDVKMFKNGRLELERARRNKHDAMVTFQQGGQMIVDVKNIENGILIGESENFGKISLPLNALKSMRLNIWRREKKEEDE